jgi:hypothetical protein
MKDLTTEERELLLSLRLSDEEKSIANQMGIAHADLYRQKYADHISDLGGRIAALAFDNQCKERGWK